jgi:BirA family biotin operon repressor/biotin-[acetyl-CoA-carboxylase] ligase
VEANPTVLAAAIIDGFFEAFETFEKQGLAPFMSAFRERSAVQGMVTLTWTGGSAEGRFAGYDDEGAILIETDGKTQRFVAGEISLRGEKGYV